MKLPHPQEKLAGCVWLPRFIAKIRIFLKGDLPASYRVAFGSRVGIDGYFLHHFQIQLPQLVVAVRRASSEDEVAKWFLSQPGVTSSAIAEWNIFSSTIGAPGHKGRITLHIVKWFLYPKSCFRTPRSLFEAIVIDEDLERIQRTESELN